jgi:phosphatidylglycerophosphate synthase
MLYNMRERFSKMSVKVGIVFSRLRLSPNQWTILTLVPTFVALYFLINQSFLFAALFFLVAAFFDIIDGSVARVTGKVTKLGAYLDTIVDRYVEGIIIIGLLFIALPTFFVPAYIWLFIYFFGAMMTTYAKAAAKEKELVEKELRGGVLERAERMILLFAGLVLAYFNTIYLVYIIVLVAVLSNISALQRIYKASRSSKK